MKTPNAKYYVYALLDPRKDDSIFYIGKGTWVKRRGYNNRYENHLHRARAGYKSPTCAKIRKIERCGMVVGFVILNYWKYERDALNEERRAIDSLGLDNLTNLMDGGIGSSHSEETRLKLIEALKRRPPVSDATRAKLAAAGKGRVVSEETRAKISKANKKWRASHPVQYKPGTLEAMSERMKGNGLGIGYKHTDDAKERIRESLIGNQRSLGYRHTDEAKAKISEASRGRVYSDEAKENMSAAAKKRGVHDNTRSAAVAYHTGRPLSAEHRQKISAANKGRKVSDETKRIISERALVRQAIKVINELLDRIAA